MGGGVCVVFAGGLALCGSYGDFSRQINYFGDFRVVFDYFFPGLMPAEPLNIPDWLINDWDTYYQTTIQPVLENPANAPEIEQLLTVVGAPYDSAFPMTNTLTIQGLLWYNVFATNDGAAKLGGQPFTNTIRMYAGSDDDHALNAGVARFSADQTALDEIAANYQTSGELTVPLVTLHTTGDPIAPSWHATVYGDKVVAAGRSIWYDHVAVDRYGHCAFTPAEVLAAFGRLVEMAHTHRVFLPFVATLP